MNSTHKALADHMKQVFFGGNWTCANVKDTLSNVTVEQATRKVHDFNTIAALTYHIHYFVKVASQVLNGGPLMGNDKLSFDVPDFKSEPEWHSFLQKVHRDAERFIDLIEQMDENLLDQYFTESKYGTYFRNIQGIIEHTHYHLGQISLLKKWITQTQK